MGTLSGLRWSYGYEGAPTTTLEREPGKAGHRLEPGWS